MKVSDVVVVPCEHNKRVFEKYTNKPVEVCHEGVDVESYPYVERKYPKDRKFVFLFIGANNPRKGTEHITLAWEEFAKKHDDCLLVMKTTQRSDPTFEAIDDEGKIQTVKLERERIMRAGNSIIVDTRYLPETTEQEFDYSLPLSMQDVYRYAHCFLFPTRGEGFGLTLAEAAATGLPCIYTNYSGPADFMRYGYKLFYTLSPIAFINPGGHKTQYKSWAASVSVDSLVEQMEYVKEHYDEALEKGRKQSEVMQQFTWENSAQRLIDIIEKYKDKPRVTKKPSKPIHMFMRLMRSGSTTLATMFRQHPGCTDLDHRKIDHNTEITIDAHRLHYGFHHRLGIEDAKYFTILRDPADWLVSLYHLDCARRALEMDFGEWYDTVGVCSTYQYNVTRDRMTRWYEKHLHADGITEVIKKLQEFWIVGITDELDILIEFFAYYFGLEYDGTRKRVTGERTDIENEHLDMKKRFELTEKWREKIYRENPNDLQLYNAACELWEEVKERICAPV
jgi:hypothetical protein